MPRAFSNTVTRVFSASYKFHSDKKIARVGYELYTSTVNDYSSFKMHEAISLMHTLTLSRDQMRKLRYTMALKGIYFPTSNELLEARKKLRPVITSVLDGKGVSGTTQSAYAIQLKDY